MNIIKDQALLPDLFIMLNSLFVMHLFKDLHRNGL